jgi:hypothetical protein
MMMYVAHIPLARGFSPTSAPSLPTVPQRRASGVAHGQDTVLTALDISVNRLKPLPLFDQELIVCK